MASREIPPPPSQTSESVRVRFRPGVAEQTAPWAGPGFRIGCAALKGVGCLRASGGPVSAPVMGLAAPVCGRVGPQWRRGRLGGPPGPTTAPQSPERCRRSQYPSPPPGLAASGVAGEPWGGGRCGWVPGVRRPPGRGEVSATGGGRGANHKRVTSGPMDGWGSSCGDAETWCMDAMNAG